MKKFFSLAMAAMCILANIVWADNAPIAEFNPSTGELFVANAIITHGGKTYNSEITLPPKSLVAIKVGEKTYLYHTDQGNVPLTDQSSDEAVGFLAGGYLQASANPPANTAPSGNHSESKGSTGCFLNSLLSWAFTETVVQAVPDWTFDRVGIFITSEADGYFTFENGVNRTACLKRANGKANVLLSRTFMDPRIIGRMKDAVSGHFDKAVSIEERSSVKLKPSSGEQIIVQGAVARITLNPIVTSLALTLNGDLRDSIWMDISTDGDLFVKLNALDYYLVFLHGLKEILGETPVATAGAFCYDSIADSIFEIFEYLGPTFLLGDSETTRQDFIDRMTEVMIVDNVACFTQAACDATTELTCQTLVSAVHAFLGVLSTASWLFNDGLIGSFDVATHTAYGQWTVEEAPDTPPVVNFIAPIDGSTAPYGQTTQFTATATDDTYVQTLKFYTWDNQLTQTYTSTGPSDTRFENGIGPSWKLSDKYQSGQLVSVNVEATDSSGKKSSKNIWVYIGSQTCNSHASTFCANNTIHWKDSCGNDEGLKEDCGTNATCNGGTCVPNVNHCATVKCKNGNPWCYDSNGNPDHQSDTCTAQEKCSSGQCVPIDQCATKECYNGDVWCYDENGNRTNKSEDCGDGTCSDGECIAANPCPDNNCNIYFDETCHGVSIDRVKGWACNNCPGGTCALKGTLAWAPCNWLQIEKVNYFLHFPALNLKVQIDSDYVNLSGAYLEVCLPTGGVNLWRTNIPANAYAHPDLEIHWKGCNKTTVIDMSYCQY